MIRPIELNTQKQNVQTHVYKGVQGNVHPLYILMVTIVISVTLFRQHDITAPLIPQNLLLYHQQFNTLTPLLFMMVILCTMKFSAIWERSRKKVWLLAFLRAMHGPSFWELESAQQQVHSSVIIVCSLHTEYWTHTGLEKSTCVNRIRRRKDYAFGKCVGYSYKE